MSDEIPDVTKSRVFRMIVGVEVLITVDGEREVTIDADPDGTPWLRLDTDDGLLGRVEPDAMFRELVQDHDAGPDLWTSVVRTRCDSIEELK